MSGQLQLLASELDREAGGETEETGASLQTLADDSRKLAEVIQRNIEGLRQPAPTLVQIGCRRQVLRHVP